MVPNDLLIGGQRIATPGVDTDFRACGGEMTFGDMIASGAYKLINAIEAVYRFVTGR